MSSLAAILDANVLFPASLRDTLLRAAAVGLYRLYWSQDIFGRGAKESDPEKELGS